MITAGIDCGAKNCKAIIIKDGLIIGKALVATGFYQQEAVDESLDKAMKRAGITRNDIDKIGGTGSGKDAIHIADIKVNDIKAIGKGAHYFYPNARTVADIGAEEVRAVKLDENGEILDFATNEKCAAGAGSFIEAMARALEIPLEEMGLLALRAEKEININAQCVIFAESEVIGLIHSKAKKSDISKAIHDSIASRIISMVRRIGINEDIAMFGGLGYNPAFREAIKQELKINELFIPDTPEYGAAVGAAIIAAGEK